MSKIFYDRLIVYEEVEKGIKKVAKTSEERDELWKIVDELVHHKAMGFILGKLPQKHHEEFLERFHKAPYDEALFDFLKEKVGGNIEELLRQELGGLSFELLTEILGSKQK